MDRHALAACAQPSASADLACVILDIFDCTVEDAQRALPTLGFNSAAIAGEPAREVRSAGFGFIVARISARLIHSA
jgi:hypothetical protein